MPGFSLDSVLTKRALVLVFFIGLIGLTYVIATQYVKQMHTDPVAFANPARDEEAQLTNALKFRQQRDELSRQLNLVKKAYGQQSCEQLNILKEAGKVTDTRVSENGGWCAAASTPGSAVHMWDTGFSTALSKFLKGKTVASFGDGPGMYKKHLDSLGEVLSYTAYDGAPYCENVTNGMVKFLDLTAPQFGLPAFDWVVSVEVGEHIPAKFEDTYLNNLVRHAREGIILSWATPGQPGLSHVNNKPLVDVVAQMNKRGFDINKDAGSPLRDAAKFQWLRANVHVYYRQNPKTFIIEDT